MAIETITSEAYVQRNLSAPLLNNGHHPNERIIGNETNGTGPVEEHTDEQALFFRGRITTLLLANRQNLESIYPEVGFDLGELRGQITSENNLKKEYKRELKAELAAWIATNDQRVLVTDSGRKRKTPSSINQAAKRVAGQILVHSRKDLSGIEEFAAYFQADPGKSQQLQTLKGRIEGLNTYQKQLGRRHRQASYYLRDATQLTIWQDYLDNHQRIHHDYDFAKGLPDTLQASELVTKIETVIPAEVRSGKQPRNRLRRELWQYAQVLEQVRTQQKTALIPNQPQVSLDEHTNLAVEHSPGTVQVVIESSDKRLARVAAFIGVSAAAAGLAMLINQFLRNPQQVVEQKSADPDEGLRSPETNFTAEGQLVFEPPPPTPHSLERFGRDNVIISERVYDPTSQDQARPTFPPAINPTTDYPPVEVFNTSRLETRVRTAIEDTQRAVAAETPILHPAAIAAIQKEQDEKTKAAVPTRISPSTPIPVSTPISTPVRSTFSVASVESTTPVVAATATKVLEVEKKVQPATPTARPTEVKPRGGFNITKGEIEKLRLIRDGRPYSCMEFLGDIEAEMGDLGRGVVITMNGIVAAESNCDPNALSVAGSEGPFQIHRGSHQSWVERMFGMPFSRAVRDIKISAQIARKIFLGQGYQAWDVCGLGYKRFLKPVLACLRYSG